MKVNDLNAAIKLITRITNPSSLSKLYNSVEISNDKIRCCSEFGNIEMTIPETGIKTPHLVNAQAITALATLPQENELEFSTITETVEQDGAQVEIETGIQWKSGRAHAKLNFVAEDHKIPKIKHDNFPWIPPETFSEALIVASSACEAAAVSIGLYGTTIKKENGKLQIMSSNQIALAAAEIEDTGYPFEQITLRPPIPRNIKDIITHCKTYALDVNEKGVWIKGDWLAAHLPLGAKLEFDLSKVAQKFQGATQVVKVDNVSVKKFITRSRSLTDNKAPFKVGIKIADGQLTLQHRGKASEMEEFFMADGVPKDLTYNSVSFPADMLLEPLEFVSSVVLDYLPEQRIVLRGENPNFSFILGGDQA